MCRHDAKKRASKTVKNYKSCGSTNVEKRMKRLLHELGRKGSSVLHDDHDDCDDDNDSEHDADVAALTLRQCATSLCF
jgi:hypothetical protein